LLIVEILLSPFTLHPSPFKKRAGRQHAAPRYHPVEQTQKNARAAAALSSAAGNKEGAEQASDSVAWRRIWGVVPEVETSCRHRHQKAAEPSAARDDIKTPGRALSFEQ